MQRHKSNNIFSVEPETGDDAINVSSGKFKYLYQINKIKQIRFL